MTDSGLYVRIQHDGKWTSMDLFNLTDQELERFFRQKENSETTKWVIAVIHIAKGER